MDLSSLMNGGRAPRQDFITLSAGGAPVRSPGVCEISSAGIQFKWDEPTGYGYSGGSLALIGGRMSEFDVAISIWQPAQWKEWTAFERVLVSGLEKQRAAAAREALSAVRDPFRSAADPTVVVRHPILAMPPLRIQRVVVSEVSQFVQGDTGLWKCTVKFKPWRPRKAVEAKIGGVPDVGKDPITEDKEIRALVNEVHELGGADLRYLG